MSGVATYLLWEVTKKITKNFTHCVSFGGSAKFGVNLIKLANWGANYNEKTDVFWIVGFFTPKSGQNCCEIR